MGDEYVAFDVEVVEMALGCLIVGSVSQLRFVVHHDGFDSLQCDRKASPLIMPVTGVLKLFHEATSVQYVRHGSFAIAVDGFETSK